MLPDGGKGFFSCYLTLAIQHRHIAFIQRHAGRFRIARQCAALGVSRSGYYAWRGRGLSRRAADDERLLQDIRAVHARSREAYGAFKTWKVLNRAGIACGKHRVARLRRHAGIEARRKRRFRVTVRTIL